MAPKPFHIEVFDVFGEGSLPSFLMVVGDSSELPWVQAKLAGHLDLGMRQTIPSSGLNPGQELLWNTPLLRHRQLGLSLTVGVQRTQP